MQVLPESENPAPDSEIPRPLMSLPLPITSWFANTYVRVATSLRGCTPKSP